MSESINSKIRRFNTGRIIEHWVLVFTFTILVVTGITQKFFSGNLSLWLISSLGGIDRVRLVHRSAAVIFSLLSVQHILIGIIYTVSKKWQPSMIINKNDFTDAVQNIKYYIGMENHPAYCDRYDYKQKFEYWVVVFSGVIMILTGVALWFPVYITRFLPGEIIPVAKALHTNQALFMFLIIAIWHIYNSIFSPNVFPLDPSIFTGYISRERMVREHPIELARIEGNPLEEIIEHHQFEPIEFPAAPENKPR